MGEERFIRIDPRDFISPPFQTCPQCGRETFGVLMIPGRHYVRRCRERECWHTAHFPLPPLKKTVIYVDQFAISNMMVALNPATEAHRAGRVNPIWLDLFRWLDHLAKLQLIVCPDSGFHYDESIVSPFYRALKRMYELLSGGVTFQDSSYIEQSQLIVSVKEWMSGQATPRFDLNTRDIITGELDRWWDRFHVTANMNVPEEWVEDLRRQREQTHEIMREVFERWQREQPPFDEVFAEEVAAYGRSLVQSWLRLMKRWIRVYSGQEPLSLELLGPPPVRTLHEIQDALRESGVADEEVWPKTIEFLTSDYLQRIPFLRLRSMLFASISRKAAAGQRRLPTRGFVTDVMMASCLLPYCDAMLVDNEIAAFLSEQPLASEVVRFGTRVLSLNTIQEFFSYLDSIEAAASAEHLELVRTVYGPEWVRPFETVYRQEGGES